MLVKKEICSKLSDQEIIEYSLRDINYFSCLYNRYEQQLSRYIRNISYADAQESNDILQEAFIKIWKNLNSYNQSLKLSSWIYRIVHNETISFCRKKRSYGKNNHMDLDDPRISQMYADGDEEISKENRFFLIHEVLDQLELKYKGILILKFMENMNYKEISDVLKIPEGTVATRINRAKKAFIKIAEKQNISFNE